MSRCLILGASGLIGSHLLNACQAASIPHQGTSYRFNHVDLWPLDLRDSHAVEEVIADYEPDIVFLAAGWSDSGYAECHPRECRSIIVDGTRKVAEAIARQGSRLVIFSSSEVFGDQSGTRLESDRTTPINVRAEAHAEAEAIVRALLPDGHLIVRTNMVFGQDDRGRSKVAGWLRRWSRGQTIEVTTDCQCQPTPATDLANITLQLAEMNVTGTLHIVGPDRHTEATFARLIAHVHGYDVDTIRTASAQQLDDPRPLAIALSRGRLRQLLGSQAIRKPAEALRAMRDVQTLIRAA